MKAEAERAKEEMAQKPEHTDEDETMSTDANNSTNDGIEAEMDNAASADGWDVLHHHGNVWLAVGPDENAFVVDLNDSGPTTRPFGVGNETANYGTKEVKKQNEAIRAVIRNGPSDRREPNVYHDPTSVQTGGNSGNSGSSGSSESGGSDGDGDDDPSNKEVDTSLTQDHGYTEEDREIMIDTVEDWLERAGEFESDFHAEHMEVEFGEIDHDGEAVPGVAIRRKAPFETPFHSGNDWNDKDGWDDFKDATKSIMQSKDAIIYKQEGYDAVNFIPAEHVEEVAG